MKAKVSTCVYCKADLRKSKASESHIVPASLGGRIKLRGAVCKTCNGKFAADVEDPFKDRWAWLLWYFGIKGRRGAFAPFRASIDLAGRELAITIRSRTTPPNIPPIIEKDPSGKKYVQLIGSTKYVETKKAEWEKKNSSTAWKEHDISGVRDANIRFPIDVDSLDGLYSRRLAAKVAFEFWGLRRKPDILLETEYDPVREFIKTGTEGEKPLCGLLSDENLICRNLNISVPYHAISLVIHPSSSVLGSIVVFFGMFYYWVILNSRYHLTTAMSDLFINGPMIKKPKQAVLVGTSRLPRIPWERIRASDPDRVRKAWNLAKRQFQQTSQG